MSTRIKRDQAVDGAWAAPNYLQDNETHILSVPEHIGNLVLQNKEGIQFIVTDAKRPFIYGVTTKDQLEFKVRFSESMAEDLVEGDNEQINDKFLLDGKKVKLITDRKVDLADITTARKENAVIVTDLYVGDYDAATAEDTRSEVYFKLHPEFKLSEGTHQIQIANVGDWAGIVDSNNIVSTQTFDFKVVPNNEKPQPTIVVHSPEQWLISFNMNVESVEGKVAEDVFKIYKADDTTTPFVLGTDYEIAAIDKEGKLIEKVKAGEEVPYADRYLVEFKEDWTVYYNTDVTKENYFTSTKNPYKVVINHLRSDLNNVMAETPLNVKLNYDGVSPTIKEAVDVYSLPKHSANGLDPVTASGQQVFIAMSEPVQLRNENNTANSNPLTESQQQKRGTGGVVGIPVPTFEFVKGDETVEGALIAESIYEDDFDFVVKPKDDLSPGTWTLYIRSISDDVGNTSATVEKQVIVPEAPATQSDTKVAWAAFDNGGDKDYLYIKFTKEMDPSGAAGVSRTTNYVFNAFQLPQGSQVVRGIKDVTNEWDGVTIEMPKGAFDGAEGKEIDFRSVLNVADNFRAADGERLSGPYEVQLEDTDNDKPNFVNNDMVFEAVYHNASASATLKGAAVLSAEAFDEDGNGKLEKVTLKLDKAVTFVGGEEIKVAGRTFKATAGTGDTVVFIADGKTATTDGKNEISGTDTSSLRIAAVNGGIIINNGLVVDKAAPIVVTTKGTAGSKNITLTFSEAVRGSEADGAFNLNDLVYIDKNLTGNGGIVSVAKTKGFVTSLVVTAANELTADDVKNDTVKFNSTVEDKEGNKAVGATPGTDTTAPVVTGVADGQTYTAAVTPVSADTDIATVVLTKDGTAVAGYALGTAINTNGAYELVVTDNAGNATTVNFTVNIPAPDTTAPVVTGVADGQTYAAPVTPESTDTDIDTVVLTKDGTVVAGYALGTAISDSGDYELVVTDNAGNATTITFTIS